MHKHLTPRPSLPRSLFPHSQLFKEASHSPGHSPGSIPPPASVSAVALSAASAAPASPGDVALAEQQQQQPQSPHSVHQWRQKVGAELGAATTPRSPGGEFQDVPLGDEEDVGGALGAARFEQTRLAAAASASNLAALPVSTQPPAAPPPAQHAHSRGPFYAGTGLTPRVSEPPAGDDAVLRRDRAWRQVEQWFSTCGWRNLSSGEPLRINSAEGGPSTDALRIVAESLVLEPERGSIMTPSRWNMLMALAESLNVLPAQDVVKNPDRRQALAEALFALAATLEMEQQQGQGGGAR